MQGKDIIKATFFQLFRPVFHERNLQQIKTAGVDKYVKNLTALKLFNLLAYAQLEQFKGLREISNSLNNEIHSLYVGLDSISHSQISRRLKALPTSTFKTIFQDLIRQAGEKEKK
ncbi:transposase [Carboxydocella sp. ULO1]|nr:transposase [Carboxydocella sp. ULO1]